MLSASTWTTRSVATIWRRPRGWVRMFVCMRARSSSYFPHTKWYGGPGGFIDSPSGCKKKFTQQSNWLPQRRLFAVKTRSCVIGCFLCSLQSPWLTGWTPISPMFQHLLVMWAELQRSCIGFGPSWDQCIHTCNICNAGFLWSIAWFWQKTRICSFSAVAFVQLISRTKALNHLVLYSLQVLCRINPNWIRNHLAWFITFVHLFTDFFFHLICYLPCLP